jgi:hypothetical protein
MNTVHLVIALLVALPIHLAWAASPDEESRFVAAAKAAFDKRDANALIALTCWDRVPDKYKASGRKQYVRDVGMNATEVVLTERDPKYPDLEWTDEAGVAHRSNLPVTKQLKITFARGGRFSDARYPVGEKDGKLYLLEPAPVK